jgi:sulfate adenylyltransferase
MAMASAGDGPGRDVPQDPDASDGRIAELTRISSSLPAWSLTDVQRDDADLLQTGGYAPLTGFMTEVEAAAVRAGRKLPDGSPWPLPVTLEVDAVTASAAQEAGRLALLDDDGTLLALLVVADTWEHAGVSHLGGRIEGVRPPGRWDFAELRAPVAQVRELLADAPGPVLAAQPTGPVDQRTAIRWVRAATRLDARLVLLPPVGADPEPRHIARVRSYRVLLDHLQVDQVDARLWLLPSARDGTDPDVAALHAVVARNAGVTHLALSEPGPMAERIAALGLEPVDLERFAARTDPPPGRLDDLVAAELDRADPPPSRRGFVVLLTGLSGSGKSTVAKVLRARLSEAGDRRVTLLDGDLVRRHLSSELGFSKEHRDLNVLRIGYVASEIAKHGGIAICAPIAPYDRTRQEVRDLVTAAGGGFVLVYVATPLEVCEARDVKGLYAKARAGELPGFTGIDDPYEPPEDAEVTIDTTSSSPEAAAEQVVARLVADGWYDPT